MKAKQLLPFCMMAVMGVKGQNAEKGHYLGVDLGGGLHTFLYSPTGGEKYAGAGGLFQLQYQYMFNNRWGIGGGAGLSTLHSSARYTYNRYRFREAQDALDLDATLQGFFRCPLSNDWRFQVGLGASLNFPVSMGYKIKSGIEKYSPREGRIYRRSANVGVALDLGFLYPMNSNADWYFGLYGNYQFVSTTRKYVGTMINTRNKYVNALNSGKIDHGIMVHPLEVGIKVGVRFALNRKESCAETKKSVVKSTPTVKPETKSAPVVIEKKKATPVIKVTPNPTPQPTPVVKEEAKPAQKVDINSKYSLSPKEEAALIMRSANFSFSSAEPIFKDANTDKAFNSLKQYLKENPEKKVYLTGHTDNVGGAEANMKLSKQRAEAYKALLVRRGISPQRIVTIGKGDTEPLVENCTEECRAKNRRVELEVK